MDHHGAQRRPPLGIAHVTPTFDANRNIIGYHSNRRKPDRAKVEKVKLPHAALLAEEARYANGKDGMLRGYDTLELKRCETFVLS